MGVRYLRRDDFHIRVEDGIGRIASLEPKGDRNVRVIIRAEHLQEDLSSWVDKQSHVWPRVQAAHEQGLAVHYAIEVRPQRGVPGGKPIKAYAKREKIREMVALVRHTDPLPDLPGAPADEDGNLTASAAAAPAAAPAPAAARPPARASLGDAPPPQDPPQPPPSREEDPSTKAGWLRRLYETARTGAPLQEISWLAERCEEFGASPQEIDSARGRPAERPAAPTSSPDAQATTPAAGGAPADTTPAGVDYAKKAMAEVRDPDRVGERQRPAPALEEPTGDRPASATSGLSRRRAGSLPSDGKPWQYYNGDNPEAGVNLGSYAAGAVMDFVNLAGRLCITRIRQRNEADPQIAVVAPTKAQVRSLAELLLGIADAVQSRMREGARVDRMASSHRLARQAVREALDLSPVPWGAKPEETEEWRKEVADHALTLALVVVGILESVD